MRSLLLGLFELGDVLDIFLVDVRSMVLGIFFSLELAYVLVVWCWNPTAAILLALFILLMNGVYILLNKKDKARMLVGIVHMCLLLSIGGYCLLDPVPKQTQAELKMGKSFFAEVHENIQKDISWEKFVQENKALLKTDESTSQQDQSSDRDTTAKAIMF